MKVLAIAGGVTEDAKVCNNAGIDAYFSIFQLPMFIDEAMKPEVARHNIETTVSQIFRLIHL